MTKYIDAEKLIKFKEALADIIVSSQGICTYQDCKDIAERESLLLIDTLQQELPKKSQKNCNDCLHCVNRKDQFGWHFKGCFGGPYNGKFIAEIEECPLQQEQPEGDLEEEIKSYIKDNFTITDEVAQITEEDRMYSMGQDDMVAFAKHFYELGFNAKNE